MNTSPGKWPFGGQVAAGFLLPIVVLAVACFGMALETAVAAPLRKIASLVCSAVVVGVILGGLALAARKGWKGVLLGIALFCALLALLVGACFAIVFLISKH